MAQAIRGADFSPFFRALEEKNRSDRFVAQMNEQKRRLREAKSSRKQQMRLNFVLMALGGVAGTYGPLGAAGGAYFGSALAQAVGPEGDPSALFNLGLAGMSAYDRGQRNEQQREQDTQLLDLLQRDSGQQGVNFREQGVMSVPGAETRQATTPNREAFLRQAFQSNDPRMRQFAMTQMLTGAFRQPNLRVVTDPNTGEQTAVDFNALQAGQQVRPPRIDKKAEQDRITREVDATALINFATGGVATPASERVSKMEFTTVQNLSPRARSEIRKQISSERTAAGKGTDKFNEVAERGITRRQLAISRSGDNSDPFDTLSDVQLGGLNQSAYNKLLEQEKKGAVKLTPEEVFAEGLPVGTIAYRQANGIPKVVFKPAKEKTVPLSQKTAVTSRALTAIANRPGNKRKGADRLLGETGLDPLLVNSAVTGRLDAQARRTTDNEFKRRMQQNPDADIDAIKGDMIADDYNMDFLSPDVENKIIEKRLKKKGSKKELQFINDVGRLATDKRISKAKRIERIRQMIDARQPSKDALKFAFNKIESLQKPGEKKKFLPEGIKGIPRAARRDAERVVKAQFDDPENQLKPADRGFQFSKSYVQNLAQASSVQDNPAHKGFIEEQIRSFIFSPENANNSLVFLSKPDNVSRVETCKNRGRRKNSFPKA